jgi:zinc transporter ZupT
MYNNFIIIVGIITFFLMEKIVQNIMGGGHSHDHSHHKEEDV